MFDWWTGNGIYFNKISFLFKYYVDVAIERYWEQLLFDISINLYRKQRYIERIILWGNQERGGGEYKKIDE